MLITGILKGLAMTLKQGISAMVTNKGVVTTQYPYRRKEDPIKFRGMHKMDAGKCIACRRCVLACPNASIEMKLKEGKEKSRKLEDYVYRIDIGKCIWCGLCSEACPTNALTMSKEFELASHDKTKFIVEFSK
ncbi:MAG: NADH-quinone oxidoreductase subunit I [Candidatus Altiarchaeum hamiconexum]|uniref:NADH-quinone oxidoreductase subunit I n=1 Tax=Candidatus Altarchaeum hamiconexum TaxID=1803513 RepID=A0A8J7YYQ4_9ARCH|nr:NADH-quinone oxidoreductase subunit I [Candidatus Altarchaeum hamiconexum]NCN68275.1 NADH-quinone oxidoreductase subunit I [Candidatus Altarchaeum hamiconexum]NCS90971.1 NADH-quinone oxidoreductase subunit I [Candidatus Altarchaeum hamiconexum]